MTRTWPTCRVSLDFCRLLIDCGVSKMIEPTPHIARVKICPAILTSAKGLHSLQVPRVALASQWPEEKHEPASDLDTAVVDSLKVLDPERPIREKRTSLAICLSAFLRHHF